MIRVVIADDHVVVRQGLVHILSEEHDMTVVGEAGNAQELLAMVRTQRCDAVVLDISMPGQSGLETLQELKREHSHLPVVMLSVYPEDQYAVQALKKGAAAYITKDSAREELVRAIRQVVTRGRYISPRLAEQLAVHVATETEKPPHEALSVREYQVLCRIAAGKAMMEIAAELSLSVKTINTYRARVLEKMSMKSNAELIRYALQHRLID
ncbi:MAG: response regulator transcription factor [Candidatus Methylomirabilis oxyfera]|nr:response regulator transcription factor [Candidatus Methylomirabilis oxyfera]